MLISRFLGRSGFHVDLADDGAEAIDKLSTEKYDVVITDLMMPRVDGFGVVAWIERERPEMLGKTVVLTAYARMAGAARLNPACTTVGKPFDLEELRTLMETLV